MSCANRPKLCAPSKTKPLRSYQQNFLRFERQNPASLLGMTNDHCIDQIRGPQFCAPSPRHCWSHARRDHQPPHAVVKCDGAVTGLFDDSDGKLAHIGAKLCALGSVPPEKAQVSGTSQIREGQRMENKLDRWVEGKRSNRSAGHFRHACEHRCTSIQGHNALGGV
jgi:hypothetical protein